MFIVFVISGFWHGANWTFIVWGALNAIYFLPLMLTNKNRNNLDVVAKGKNLPSFKDLSSMIFTFSLTVFAWIFFRADDINHAVEYIHDMLTGFKYKWSYVQTINLVHWEIGYTFPLTLLVFVVFEWLGRESQYAIEYTGFKWNRILRYMIYYLIVIAILWFGGKDQQFIYFQF